MINPGRMILALQQNISKAVVGKEEAIDEFVKVMQKLMK